MDFLIKSFKASEFIGIAHQFANDGGFNPGVIETDPNTIRADASIVSIQDNVVERFSAEQMNELNAYLLEQ